MIAYLGATLVRLERQFHVMAKALDAPQQQGQFGWFRYKDHTDTLLCFLKGVKMISTLNAALVLLQRGYVQEVNVLCRVADDCASDIIYMIKPEADRALVEKQVRFMKDFFQEEFADPTNVLGSRQKREGGTRQSVFAAFGRATDEQEILNRSDAQNMLTVTHGAMSGYVHGAYPHIMDLYGGLPPHFHISGMSGTPREREGFNQLVTHLYRAIMASAFISMKLGLTNVEKELREQLAEFETTLDCRPTDDPETLVRKEKEKKPPSR